MPNWCENNLTVSGNPEELDRFLEENRGHDHDVSPPTPLPLDFSKVAPEPPEIIANDSSEDWRRENWGTKWQPNFNDQEKIYTEHVDNNDGTKIKKAFYSFETAWSPSTIWLVEAAARYPGLRFCLIYSEPGEDFGGILICADGRVVIEEDGPATDYMNEDLLFS